MKAIRIITKALLAIALVISFVMMTAEAESASSQLLISGASMAVFYLCCKALIKMHDTTI